MIGLKRKLFQEFSPLNVSEVQAMSIATRNKEKPGPDRQKTKRNATGASMVQGDSLATVLTAKQNNAMPVKEISQNSKHKDTKKHVFKPSVLMVLDAKENKSDNTKGKAQTQLKRQRKINPGKIHSTKATADRRLVSNTMGSMLVCLGSNKNVGSSSRVSSGDVRQGRSLKKKAIKSKSKTKHDKRNQRIKMRTKKVHLESSITNGDSLMMCLAENSTIINESILVRTEPTEKPTKTLDQRRKRSKKRVLDDRTSAGELREKSNPDKKSRNNPKRLTAISCKPGGLGEFVGIMGEGLRHGQSRKEKRAPMIGSPLKSDLKTNALDSINVQEPKSSKERIDKTTKNEAKSDVSELDEVPSIIIVSLPQQVVQSQRRSSPGSISTIKTQLNVEPESTVEEAVKEPSDVKIQQPVGPFEKRQQPGTNLNVETNHTKDVPTIEPRNVDRQPTVAPSETTNANESRSKNGASTNSEEIVQKFSVGTKLQKNFKFHGWFTGKIISFDAKTGFYKVQYEDGDVEDLEECELIECKILSDGPTNVNRAKGRRRKRGANVNQDNRSRRTKRGANVNQDNRSQRTKCPIDDSKQNPSKDGTTKKELLLDGSSSNCSRNSVPDEEGAPLRRSRRRSREPIRLVDIAQSTISKDSREIEASESVRRSKRRKSQPIRLSYSTCSESKQSARSEGSKKGERAQQKSKMVTKRNHSREDSESIIEDDRKCTDHNNLDSNLYSNLKHIHSMSPSNHDHKCHDKQHFDDALRAVMPLEDISKRLTLHPSQAEDDIFDSTPMRKLFARGASNASESSTTKHPKEKDDKAARRSRRKSKEPERYGQSTSTDTKTSKKRIKSAMKKGKKGKKGSTGKKRVRISDEQPRETLIDSLEETGETDPWTQADLRALHRAKRLVDPTSFSFWEDVSEMIGDRSAVECRQKWFSLAKTPEPKKPKQKKQEGKDGDTTVNIRPYDDDIFNSTPMRAAFAIGESFGIADSDFEELGDISKIDVGSAIKVNKVDHNDANLPFNVELISCPHGYKTYLQKMGRIMRQKDTKKRQVSESMNHHALNVGKKLAERIEEGDVQVKGRLSPGGTLHVDTIGDTDTEDYLYDDEDE